MIGTPNITFSSRLERVIKDRQGPTGPSIVLWVIYASHYYFGFILLLIYVAVSVALISLIYRYITKRSGKPDELFYLLRCEKIKA
jgi:hypothetical protein